MSEQHAYEGRLDRVCEVCGKPDRHPSHVWKRSDVGQVGWAPGYDGGSGVGGNDEALLPRGSIIPRLMIEQEQRRSTQLEADVKRLTAENEELRKRPPRDTYEWLRDRYLRLRAAAVNILDHEPYGEEWESLRREHIDNLRDALALGKRPADDEHAES